MIDLSIDLKQDQFLQDMKSWAGDLFNNSAVRWINYKKFKDKSNTAYIHFWSPADKQKFMAFVRSKQFDQNNKYVPLTNECIFNLKEDDINRPNAINFRTPLTQSTRELVNEGRKLVKKKIIDKCTLMNGYVYIKLKSQSKMILIESVERLAAMTESLLMDLD
jgi:hypothetical protein